MSRYQRLLAVILFLALPLLLFQLSGLRQHLNLAFLQQLIQQHPASGLLFFVLLFALGNLVQLPGWIFLAAAVLALGQFWGGVATYVAACITCVLTFLLIRSIGGDALRTIDKPIAMRLLQRLDAHPLRNVALLRLMFQTVPTLNYALALSGIPFRPYLAGTLLGLPLPIMLYCVFFNQLAHWLHLA